MNEYEILGPHTITTLVEVVNYYIKNKWSPYGTPFTSNGKFYQVMMR